MLLKIAARRSHLARLQAELVGEALKQKHSDLRIEYVWLQSQGDINLTTPLWKMPEKGVFTADLTSGLIAGDYDIVVHSWKDLPTEENPRTSIAATLHREDPRDLLLWRKTSTGKVNLRVSSSSPRRGYSGGEFLRWALPWEISSLEFESIRGNIPTRLRKFLEGDTDGIFFAKAAIDRLLSARGPEYDSMREELATALAKCRFMVVPLSASPAAPAQGALALEVRRDRDDVLRLLPAVNSAADYECVQEERRRFREYGGGCHQKIGITVLKKDFGKVMFLRGMTPDERILDELRVIDRPAKVKVPAARMFPVKPQDSHFYEREKIAVELYRLQSRDLWVAREQALPEGFKPDEEQVVWTAGLSSWRKLARRGVWVHGCAESLGEHESERLEILLGRTPHFLKLSHNEAEEVASESGEKDFLATYKLKTLRELPDLRGKTHFYWLSYSSFRRAVDAYPEILKGQHACGPGNTATLIAKHAGIQPEIFVSHSEWFNAYKEG